MPHIINNFIPLGGQHCITNSLKQIFAFNGYPISEEMLFGIGQGLAFVYVNLAQSPLISGRIKPFDFETNIASSLNISLKCKQTKKINTATEKLKLALKNNLPIMLYADMAYLKYLNLDENNHFGGHSIVVFGLDEEKNFFYISDRDSNTQKILTPKGYIGNDFHLLSFEELELARSSNHRPYPANNKWLEFDFSRATKITAKNITQAILNTVDAMLNPPAKLLGINGILKFSQEIKKWQSFDKNKLKLAGITNYFMINANGGTGGGAFRKMYGNFLIAAADLLAIKKLEDFGEEFIKIAKKWDLVADKLKLLYEIGEIKLLEELSYMIKQIYNDELQSLNKLKDQFQ